MKTKFKTPDQIAERKEFVSGASDASIELKSNTFSELKRMTAEQIMNRIVEVDDQYHIMKWGLWWGLRQKYKSDTLFGQAVSRMRDDPVYARCVGTQQTINRYCSAGKFCEEYKIYRLDKVKLYPNVVYELSRPANADIAKEIYQEIKDKYISDETTKLKIEDLRRRIAKAKAIDSNIAENVQPDQPESPARPSIRRVIEVVKGVAQSAKEELVQAINYDQDEMELIKTIIDENQPVTVDQQPEDENDESEYLPAPVNHAPRRALLDALGRVDASTVSDEQAIAEIIEVIGMYSNRPFIRVIAIYKALIEKLNDGIKEQQVKGYTKK